MENDVMEGGCPLSAKLCEDIIKEYGEEKPIKKIAKDLGISEVKVRRVLITEKLWQSKTSLRIQEYLDEGLSTREIADKVHVTEKAVQQYLPYRKGIYNSDEPSVAAANSAAYRERINVLKENILRRKTKIEEGEVVMEEHKVEQNTGVENQERYEGALLPPEGADGSTFRCKDMPIRLHLELVLDKYGGQLDQDTIFALKTFGDVKYGNTISRDVIVPSSMQLWALNYMIQKCFGWQNSHLHEFELPDGQLERITDGVAGKYSKLVGLVFRSPLMDEDDVFWADDYVYGSFKTWVRRKYTGPYASLCRGEDLKACVKDMRKLRKSDAYVSVEHYVSRNRDRYGFPRAISKEEYEKTKDVVGEFEDVVQYGTAEKFRTEVYAFDDIPLKAYIRGFDCNCCRLLEKLSIGEILSLHGKGIDEKIAPSDTPAASYDDALRIMGGGQRSDGKLSDVLLYNYDFGDDWQVRITGSYGAKDLIDSGRLSQEELEESVLLLKEKYRPVCIAQDGCFVLDDVGGVDGFKQFLMAINHPGKIDEYDDAAGYLYGPYMDKKESLAWARNLGWSQRKVSNKNLL